MGSGQNMSPQNGERPSLGLVLVRYGIGALMVLAGIVMIAVNPGGLGVDGFAMAAGGGLSVLLINYLFRVSVSSNRDREREEDARRYFDVHGEWPEDEPRRARGWTLAPGVMTAEDDQPDRPRERSGRRA